MRTALVGAGSVGTAVAHLLSNAGHDIVAVASRTPDSANEASRRLDASVCPIDALPEVDLILIGAPDGSIEEVDRTIAPRVGSGTHVCHFAGALGPSVLRSSLEAGAAGCAIHPVQACPSIDAGIARLPGSAWGVTCSNPRAEQVMIEMIENDLRGSAVVVAEDSRPMWHAAAVMTSNGIAALMAVGESLLSEIGVGDPTSVLAPLARGTIDNAREGGGGGATLTGPVVRGEIDTVERHLAALERVGRIHAVRYRAVATLIAQLAKDSGRIDAETAEDMIKRLSQ